MTLVLVFLLGIFCGWNMAKWFAIWGMSKAMSEGRLFIFNDNGQWFPHNPRINHPGMK